MVIALFFILLNKYTTIHKIPPESERAKYMKGRNLHIRDVQGQGQTGPRLRKTQSPLALIFRRI